MYRYFTSLFSKTKDKLDPEESSPLDRMEKGFEPANSQDEPPPFSPLTDIAISLGDILHSLDRRATEAEPPPSTAAGDPTKFLPRQIYLVEGQYRDRDGKTIACIQSTINSFFYTKEGGPKGPPRPSVIDLRTAQDLNLIPVGDSPSIVELMQSQLMSSSPSSLSLSRLGKTALYLELSRPSPIPGVPQKKALAIGTLLQSPLIRDPLYDACRDLEASETAILSCWDPKFQLAGSISKLYYRAHPYVNDYLNSSTLALSFNTYSTLGKRTVEVGMMGVSAIMFTGFALTEGYRTLTGNASPQALVGYADSFAASTPLGAFAPMGLSLGSPALNTAIAAGAAFSSATTLQSSYDWLKADASMLPLMHKKLCEVAQYYRAMKQIYETLKDNPHGILSSLEYFHDLKDLFHSDNVDVQYMLQLLESSTFSHASNKGYLTGPGEILLAWEMLHNGGERGKKKKDKGGDKDPDSKKETPPPKLLPGDHIRAAFAKAIPAVGEVNALLFKMELVQSSRNNPDAVQYSIPEFVSSHQGPVCHAEEFWSPALGNQPVTNSLRVGILAPSQGVILTGPNTGGKSSAMRALALGVVLAHSGIAPAAHMKLTPLDYLGSSANITDDPDRALSSHEAQCQRMTEIKRFGTCSSLTSMTFLDEAYTQTTSTDGAALLGSELRELASNPRNSTIAVTHFRDEVAASMPELMVVDTQRPAFANYQIHQNHLLSPGISHEYNAHEVHARVQTTKGLVLADSKGSENRPKPD